MEPVPSYEDLIWLFEEEPVYRYAADERAAGYEFDWRELWPYTAVTFRTTRAGYDIEMYIEPGYEIVRLPGSLIMGVVPVLAAAGRRGAAAATRGASATVVDDDDRGTATCRRQMATSGGGACNRASRGG